MDVKQYDNVNMKATQDTVTYKTIGKHGDYRPGMVSGECHWGFKPGSTGPTHTCPIISLRIQTL